MKLSVQLYSLRDFMSFQEMLPYCAERGFQYVEPAGLYQKSPGELAKLIKEAGLSAPSFHFSLKLLEERWEELAAELKTCGAEHFVMPFADAQSLEELEEIASRLQKLALSLKAKCIHLHYHNHSHEISKEFRGESMMNLLLDLAPDLYWQVDVGWVTAGGGDLTEYLAKWQGRITMLHIKDIMPSKMLTKNSQNPKIKAIDGLETVVGGAASKDGQPEFMGQGVVDFASIFAQAKAQGIDFFIIENDNPANADNFISSGRKLVESHWN